MIKKLGLSITSVITLMIVMTLLRTRTMTLLKDIQGETNSPCSSEEVFHNGYQKCVNIDDLTSINKQYIKEKQEINIYSKDENYKNCPNGFKFDDYSGKCISIEKEKPKEKLIEESKSYW